MSALSIPPSQKTNLSVGLESIHNYANVLNPGTFVGTNQYSVVAVYTTQVEVAASEGDEEMVEAAEVQVQTDFYEEEIVAVSADNAAGGEEEASSLRTEETSETVDVAKALETLTKTFALRKESLGQDVLTGKSNDSSINEEPGSVNAPDEGETHETSDQTEEKRETVEEMKEDLQPESNMNSCTDLNDDHEEEEEMMEVPSEDPGPETQQQSPSSASVRRSTRLQKKTSPSWQRKIQKSSRESSEEPKMYKKTFYTLIP